MGCACIRTSNSIIPSKKSPNKKYNKKDIYRKNYLFSIKMEAWIQILDYLPYKQLNVTGKVCKSFNLIAMSQALLSKFFKNKNYKRNIIDKRIYGNNLLGIMNKSSERFQYKDISNELDSSNTLMSQDKFYLGSPKFPSERNTNYQTAKEEKKVIKSSCIDFFSKDEIEGNSQNLYLLINNSKETLSEMDKTPNFNLFESMNQINNTSYQISNLYNSNSEDPRKIAIFEVKQKLSKNQIMNKVDIIKHPLKSTSQNSKYDKQIVFQNNNINNNIININSNNEDTVRIIKISK